MIALWYNAAGKIAECPHAEPGQRSFSVDASPAVDPFAPATYVLTRKARRAIARRASGPGRRLARPVAARQMRKITPRKIETYRGHRLSDGQREVLLFLPDGQRPTEAMCRDADRWLRRRDRAAILSTPDTKGDA